MRPANQLVTPQPKYFIFFSKVLQCIDQMPWWQLWQCWWISDLDPRPACFKIKVKAKA